MDRIRIALTAPLLALCLVGCPNAYRAGWIATAATIDARDATDKGISKAFQDHIESCKAKHGANQIDLAKCVESSGAYRAASAWIQVVLPAINTAVKTAKATLEIAERVQASGDSTTKKVLGALKDGVCKLIPVLKEWKHLFSAEAKVALGYLDLIKVVCP